MKLHRVLAVALALGALISLTVSAGPIIKTIDAGSTDQTVVIRIIDATLGTPETGVAYNTPGLDLKYWLHGENAVADITEVTQTVNGVHSDGGFVHLGNGYYRLDLPDAAVTGFNAVEIFGTVTDMIVLGGTVQLTSANTILTTVDATVDAIKLTTDKLDDTLEDDGGIYRFTTNALEQAPSGGGALTQADLGIHETTIATLASQTSFTLTSGSADDNTYNGWAAYLQDQTTATQVALGEVEDYIGSTRTITLSADPAIFTVATGDTISLLPAFLNAGVNVIRIEGVDATDQLDAHAAAGLDAAGVRAAVGLASANLDTQLVAIDSVVGTNNTITSAIQVTTDKLDDTLEDNAGTYRFTSNALETAPTGNGESLDAIADAVWDELLSGHATVGSAGDALSDAQSGGNAPTVTEIRTEMDSNSTQLAAIVAGVGGLNDLDATAVQTAAAAALTAYDPPTRAELTTDTNSVLTAVGDVPTNTELSTALDSADDATLSAIAALQAVLDGISDGSGTLLGCSFQIDTAPAIGEFYLTVSGCSAP